MVIDVLLTKTGMAMQDALIVSWLVQEGDFVQKGDPLVEIETEKVTSEVEAQATGVLVEICVPEGEVADVEAVIARIQVGEAAVQDELAEPPSVTPERVAHDSSPVLQSGPEESPVLGLGTTLPLGRKRQTIGRRMLNSLSGSAQLTLFSEADMTAAVARRKEWMVETGRVTYTDILVYLVARVIERFPLLNARLEGDEIVVAEKVNIGVAVALPDGLIVPVVKDASGKPLAEISQETARLVDKARLGDLGEEDVSGGTFTVSNLGTYGIDLFTPIINPPEVAILGVGRIADRPVVVDGQLAVRSLMGLSLTIDHLVIDGAPGAEFLQALVAVLEAAEF